MLIITTLLLFSLLKKEPLGRGRLALHFSCSADPTRNIPVCFGFCILSSLLLPFWVETVSIGEKVSIVIERLESAYLVSAC